MTSVAPEAQVFGRVADEYDAGRPSYPSAVLEVLQTEVGLGPGCEVADVAAGTGKLTRLLVASGATVTAVEPTEGMAATLVRSLPQVPVVSAAAEALPFATDSFDLVTVAQAFHWFRIFDAMVEIARVLRPGGALAIVFNQRDESVPWVAAMSERLAWQRFNQVQLQGSDWAALLAGVGYLDGGTTVTRWAQPMNRSLLASRVRSVSYVAAADAATQQRYVDDVLALTEGLGDTFDLPYRTQVWWARAAPP